MSEEIIEPIDKPQIAVFLHRGSTLHYVRVPSVSQESKDQALDHLARVLQHHYRPDMDFYLWADDAPPGAVIHDLRRPADITTFITNLSESEEVIKNALRD